MAIGLWKKDRILKTYGEQAYVNGYMVSVPTTKLVKLDVQTMSDTVATTPDGSFSVQRLKTFGDEPIKPTNKTQGVIGDKLWFQGKWFECTATRLSENTVIAHWTSEFVECVDQEPAP